VAVGTQEAIVLCMLGVVDPGDEVLVPSPRYTTCDTSIVLCGGVPVPVPTLERDDFALLPREIERRITGRSKVLVLVSPNNPTDAVMHPEVIQEIANLARRHDLLVISDEIYEKLIFNGHEHLSVGSLVDMKGRTVTVNSFSKAYAMTGWRIGYLAAPEPFVRAMIEFDTLLASVQAHPPSSRRWLP
jgi:aminotransferase